MFTLTFWKDAAERAVSTFAQSAVSLVTVGSAFADVDWVFVASVSGVASLLSILKALAASTAGPHADASFVDTHA
jgi:hypothetical protein